jgi:hypothetical protein
MNYKQALALGFEISSFFIVSYFAHEPISEHFQWDPGLTLAGLMTLSMIVWTYHAFLYTKDV